MRAQGLECMKHEGSGTGVHEAESSGTGVHKAIGLRDRSA